MIPSPRFHRLAAGAFLLALTASQALAQQLPSPTPAPELRPPDPLTWVLPLPLRDLIALGVLALLVLGGITWGILAWIRRRPAPPPPTPREAAMTSLQALRPKAQTTDPYPLSIEVSDVLRHYVAREYQLAATEQTSVEFLAAATRNPRFSEADKTLLATFLEKADLIKFARVHATAADSEQLLEQATRFVKGEQG